MSLYVDLPDSMQRERVHIVAKGLEPSNTYKLLLRLRHKLGTHVSYAVFKADSTGEIDVATAKPIRGTYNDVDAMGLFRSVQPCNDFKFGGYLRCTPPVPFIYNLSLLDSSDDELASVPIKKHWMHPALERTEIEEDGFCGTLFKPPGDGPFPAVIDISGTGGGLHEHKGSMLASEGFVVLCVAFFQYKDLVDDLADVEVEYFERPILWLQRQPFTTDRLGIQGVSFGGLIVNILASRFPQINAVVSINGSHVQNELMHLKNNANLLPQPRLAGHLVYFVNKIAISNQSIRHTEYEKSAEIDYQRIPKSTSFRLVASMDDLVSPSVFWSRYMSERLKESGHEVEVDLVCGGHIMEPPYFPHHDKVYARFQGFCSGYGGEIVLHGKSQELSWARTIEFFTRTLGQPAKMPEWNRLKHNEIKSNL
ncbi:BAAT/acyl-CoA thioester hydrolase protein [Ancylostoma caninum]|uniref:BAAT/acyl-CoA thioester hydrolase protein n=1 Tax=Ancylostoma caninum TaxID=29170 RepID=A0A368GFR8_ANCCA|nr:BAAT/acyl-CoA thioester hydrolase protein [Ancylostoma caninum]